MSINYTPRTWVAAEVVTAAEMNTEIRDPFIGVQAAWTGYTPALTAVTTNPTLGTGNTIVGTYSRVGKSIEGEFDILFGTPGFVAGSGVYEVSLPVAAIAASSTYGSAIGWGIFFDSSAGAFYTFVLRVSAVTTVRMIITGGAGLSAVAPVIPANSDRLHASFVYQAA